MTHQNSTSAAGRSTKAGSNFTYKVSNRYNQSSEMRKKTFVRKGTLLNNDSSMLAVAEDSFATPK